MIQKFDEQQDSKLLSLVKIYENMKPKDAAVSIISGGMAGVEELYVPLNQFLHVVAILRPLYGVRWLLDRLTLKLML